MANKITMGLAATEGKDYFRANNEHLFPDVQNVKMDIS
jgi:hypothetical protein